MEVRDAAATFDPDTEDVPLLVVPVDRRPLQELYV